jgi:hypothetical protein
LAALVTLSLHYQANLEERLYDFHQGLERCTQEQPLSRSQEELEKLFQTSFDLEDYQ